MQYFVAKAWYFFYFGSLSFIRPYFSLYFTRLGYNAKTVGTLTGIMPWVYGTTGSFWAALADKTRSHRTVLVVTILLSCACETLVGFTHAFWLLLALVVMGEFFGSAPTIADAVILALCKEDGSYGKQRLWGAVAWGLGSLLIGALISKFGIQIAFICYPVICLFVVAAGSALDMSLLTSPENNEEPKHTERDVELMAVQKLKEVARTMESSDDGDGFHTITVDAEGGSDDAGIPPASEMEDVVESGLESGKMYGANGDGDDDNSESSPLMKHETSSLVKTEGLEITTGGGQPFLGKLWQVLQDAEVIVFIILSFLMGVGSGTIGNFLFLYLDELGAPEYLMGLSLMVTCAAEIPIFYGMDFILRTVGVQGTLHMVMGVFIIRLLAYALLGSLGSPWWVLVIEPLHGVTFGCAWGAGTEHSRRIAPPGLDATLQSIFGGMYFGLGFGTGALIAGILFETFGARIMFALMAAIIAVGWGSCLAVLAVLRMRV